MKMKQSLFDWNPMSLLRAGIERSGGTTVAQRQAPSAVAVAEASEPVFEAAPEADGVDTRPVIDDADINPVSLTRSQIVDRIVRINRTVSAEYLDQFEEEELALYLSHLACATSPRGGLWLRPADSPAIMSWTRDP